MGVPRRQTLCDKFDSLDDEIRRSFQHFPKLFNDFPAEVSLIHLFSKIETAQVKALYCGIVKLHRVNAQLAANALDNWEITRPGFRDKYKSVFNKELKKEVHERLLHAEKARDNIVHGKQVKDGAVRQALFDVFEYATLFSAQVKSDAGFTPFGKLTGFKGRASSLDKATSRWVLMGMKFL
ncbi:hypothetical protein [Thetidibacter halocola]|uniref:RiboL-PSP-HEPN domain-containing protein n=1 Tax=Thetidibacter halocola TaxID=2827239 RepID=A0A8J8B8H9_9RHOB|nr:hypothetical protein [Thetidibacter halocola]MBS0126226.1 hypothetical protein [Thetidibacter halocola]